MWLEAIGWLASAVLAISLLQSRVLRLRVYNLIACLLLVFYNGMLGVWPMVAVNVFLSGVNLYYLMQLWRTRHDAATYQVIPIDVGEPVLDHILARHADDIRAVFPTSASRAAEAQRAHLVVTGDELAGLVLSQPGPNPGEEQIILDYALPKYRDFTPGRFVYGPRGPFVADGVRTVVAAPDMADSEKYLTTMGFRPDDGRRVLTLAE